MLAPFSLHEIIIIFVTNVVNILTSSEKSGSSKCLPTLKFEKSLSFILGTQDAIV